jgi:hypothetical protein
MEQHYAFIKDGKVANVAVFAEQNQELADMIVQEQGYDNAVWVGINPPVKYSSYDGELFTLPTLDYLYEIGISQENQAMAEARIAAEAETINDPNSVI